LVRSFNSLFIGIGSAMKHALGYLRVIKENVSFNSLFIGIGSAMEVVLQYQTQDILGFNSLFIGIGSAIIYQIHRVEAY